MVTPRCQEHPRYPDPRKCAGCSAAANAAARKATEVQQAAGKEASTAARERAEVRRAAIDGCYACDNDGYLNGRVCHHNETARLAAAKGAAAARAALNQALGGNA